jgi:predicted SnoaL-like aldol condensation-catalyzing enzyme
MTRIAFLLAAGFLISAAPSSAAADAKEEANKKVVVEFYDTALNRKDFEVGFLREKFPQSRSEIKRVWAEGDYVILHVHAVRIPGTRGSAIVDVFKLENGKVVEHWDVIQEIPEKAANTNGMF